MRRTLASTLATTVAVGGAATTLVVDTVAAEAPGHRAEAPNPDPDLSTLEGCTAKFGLTKLNSFPILLDETITGPATPAPTLGDGLTPVATITMADDSIEQCILEPAWTDEASWEAFIGNPVPAFIPLIERPERAVYLVPGLGVGYFGLIAAGDGSTPQPVQRVEVHVVLDEEFRADFTVANPEPVFPSFPFETQEESEEYLTGLVRGSLDPSVLDEFDALLDSPEGCDGDTTASLELVAAIRALFPDSPEAATLLDEIFDTTEPVAGCPLIFIGAILRFAEVQLDESPIEVLVASQPVPVLPPTGGSGAPVALLAGLTGAAGAAALLFGRRRRTA